MTRATRAPAGLCLFASWGWYTYDKYDVRCAWEFGVQRNADQAPVERLVDLGAQVDKVLAQQLAVLEDLDRTRLLRDENAAVGRNGKGCWAVAMPSPPSL